MGTEGRRRILLLAAAAFIVMFTYWFARPARLSYFNPDDIMNLRKAWTEPATQLISETLTFSPQAYRPVGLLWYHWLFPLAGLQPALYQWVCFAIYLFNLALLYGVAVQLSGSREVGVLAALIGSFHSRLEGLYFSAWSIYDLLCFTFYFAALLYFMRLPREKAMGLIPVAVMLLLSALALSSKEMAATLPLVIAAYEMMYHRERWRRGLPVIVGTAVLTAIFCARKLLGSSLLSGSYRPEYTFSRFMANWRSFLVELFYSHPPLPTLAVWGVWAGLAGIVLLATLRGWRQSRALQFCAVFIVLTPLPVCFVEPRGMAVLYIPFAGWAILGAVLLVQVRDSLLSTARLQPAGAAALFLITAGALGAAHLHDRPYRFWPDPERETLRRFQHEFTSLHPHMPATAQILFLNDPFKPDEWTLSSLLQLYYREPDLNILRMKMEDQRDTIAKTEFDFVFTWRDGHLAELAGAQQAVRDGSGTGSSQVYP